LGSIAGFACSAEYGISVSAAADWRDHMSYMMTLRESKRRLFELPPQHVPRCQSLPRGWCCAHASLPLSLSGLFRAPPGCAGSSRVAPPP
jgi:hypothetical protein